MVFMVLLGGFCIESGKKNTQYVMNGEDFVQNFEAFLNLS
jgi:hypothetical protein